MSRRKSESEYEVGYGKPPVAPRWPKGTSGNPSGKSNPNSKRKRRAAKKADLGLDIVEALVAELNQKVPLRVGDRETTVCALQVLAKTVMRDALQGTPMVKRGALDFFLKTGAFEQQRAELVEARADEQAETYSEEDRRLLNIARDGFDPSD